MNYCSAAIEVARPASGTIPVPVHCHGPCVVAALRLYNFLLHL